MAIASPLRSPALASWFNNKDLSDCEIHVMTTAAQAAKHHSEGWPWLGVFSTLLGVIKGSNKPPNLHCNQNNASGQLQQQLKSNDDFPKTARPAQLKVYPAHRLVLKSSSAFFLARISELWQKSTTYEMTVESEAYLPAAELVIKYMYTKELVQDLPLKELLRILSIADQFQIYHVTDICAYRINAQLAVDFPAWDNVLLLLHWSHPFLKERLVPAALSAVLKRFLDLEESWADRSERAQFLQLPYQAVAWLLAQPTLKVASENTVAVAIDTWLAGSDLAAQCSHAEKGQLWRLIRGGSLGSHFLSNQLPKLPTFCNLPDCMEILSDMIQAKTMPSGVMGSELDELRTAYVFKARRPASDRAFAYLELALPVQQLTAAFDEVKTPPTIRSEFTSVAQYFAGYFWKAMLSVDAGGKYENWHNHHVGVLVHVDEQGTIPVGQYCGYNMSLSRLGQDTNCRTYQMKHCLHKVTTASLGWHGAMGADWQALAQDGKIHLGFKCTALD